MHFLTEQMQRLVGEIGRGHDERPVFVKKVRDDVSDFLDKAHDQRMIVEREARARRREERIRLQEQVAQMRHDFAEDIAGAHRAWFGASSHKKEGQRGRR